MIATSYRGVFRTYVNIHAIFRPGVHFFLTFHHFKLEAHVINRNCVFPCKILARPYQQTNLSVKSGVHGKIDHLHSCDQVPLCKFLGRKERFYRKKEFNPHRIFFWYGTKMAAVALFCTPIWLPWCHVQSWVNKNYQPVKKDWVK